MKNTIVYSAALLCVVALLQSCTKDSISTLGEQSQGVQTFTVNVSLGQSYTYSAGVGSLIVSKQASHFQTSQTGTGENGAAIYQYNPLAGYMGPDEVTLVYSPGPATSESSTGCGSHDSPPPGSSTIAIKINVTK